ncbi:MAG: hypothetical protein QNJ04_02640 [Desulfobacterales bacterium]|nr:hypothetical protein [Desulfobacterales bacterium]
MKRPGYDVPHLSPAARLVVDAGLRVPVGLTRKLWYDALNLVRRSVALCCLVGTFGDRAREKGT